MAKFKRIAISVIGNDDIIIIKNNKDIRERIKLIIEADKNISSNPIFDESVIYKIPVSSNDIESYRLSTTFERSYERDNDIIENTTIEYLALHPEDRIIYAKKHDVDIDYNDFYYDVDSYNNLTKTGEGGWIYINRNGINIQCAKYDFGELIMSETLTKDNFFE